MEFRTMYFMNGTNVREVDDEFVFDGEKYFWITEGREVTEDELRENDYYVNENEAWEVLDNLMEDIIEYEED